MESAAKEAASCRKKPSRDWLEKDQWKSIIRAQFYGLNSNIELSLESKPSASRITTWLMELILMEYRARFDVIKNTWKFFFIL